MRNLVDLAVRRAATALLVCNMFVSPAMGAPTDSRFPLPAESDLVAHVQSVLPAGWSIQRTESNRVPPGWHSAQAVATVIDISDGRQQWSLSFVPLDWIGIQFDPTRHPAPDSPDWVSQSESYKLLHGWGRQREWSWLRELGSPVSSLVNGGQWWQRFYGDRLPSVEVEASRLLREHCHGARQRSEAADSLARLGVPAVEAFRDVALHGVSRGRQAAISALGELGLPGSLEVVRAVLRDPNRDHDTDLARRIAVSACQALQARDHGPDLRVALRIARNNETAQAIANEINRIRYAPATPDLRRWLRRCGNPYFVASYAQALATLRVTDAVEDMRKAMSRSYDIPDNAANRYNRPGQMASLALQLYRLTGAWGEAQDGVRVALVDGDTGRIKVYVENMSDEPVCYFQFDHHADGIWPMEVRVWVDDVLVSPPPPETFLVGGHVPTIDPGTAAEFVFDLSVHLAPGSVYRVSGSWSEIPANRITVDRRVGLPDQPIVERTP